MAGRSPHQAVNQFLTRLQQSASCVTRSPLTIPSGGRDENAAEPHVVSFGGRPAPLRAPDAHLGLEVLHGYRIVRGEKDRGPWKVTTAYYLYSLLDDQNQELIGFHWHPEGRGPHSEPHAQLGPGLDLGIPEMLKARIPTPRLSLEEVIRLAIETFDLVPLRPDWDAILRRNQRAFQEWKMR